MRSYAALSSVPFKYLVYKTIILYPPFHRCPASKICSSYNLPPPHLPAHLPHIHLPGPTIRKERGLNQLKGGGAGHQISRRKSGRTPNQQKKGEEAGRWSVDPREPTQYLGQFLEQTPNFWINFVQHPNWPKLLFSPACTLASSCERWNSLRRSISTFYFA